ncbi:membrane protein [Collimonas fungivorans]|uniref:Glycine zipper domain-containing protein n=1 Tax=Collimonas fungivorans (strain Ter331) TaxID=1005048 RepID=G0A867_COLFT|nr:membrane protein [Collimonas fungivorans]AEK60140.1 hypothetical protein CFU_0302 [Collimonas fungivorans Ter331]
MSSIIFGRFQLQDDVHYAVSKLVQAGYPREAICSFYLNPAGQHDIYPIGGDRDKSPGAEKTDTGLAAGAAVGAGMGAGVGAAVVPVIGPVLGSLVGAHLGGLVGSLDATKDSRGKDAKDNDSRQEIRKSGMRVAVAVADDRQESAATALLKALGATDMERGNGTIADGDWRDFDPLSKPCYIDEKN